MRDRTGDSEILPSGRRLRIVHLDPRDKSSIAKFAFLLARGGAAAGTRARGTTTVTDAFRRLLAVSEAGTTSSEPGLAHGKRWYSGVYVKTRYNDGSPLRCPITTPH